MLIDDVKKEIKVQVIKMLKSKVKIFTDLLR